MVVSKVVASQLGLGFPPGRRLLAASPKRTLKWDERARQWWPQPELGTD